MSALTVGVPTEIKPDERRVAVTPDGVSELVAHDVSVLVQSGAGADVRRLGSADVLWAGDIRVNADSEIDADGLSRSFALGLPAAQPRSAGALPGQSGSFNYWAETLTF